MLLAFINVGEVLGGAGVVDHGLQAVELLVGRERGRFGHLRHFQLVGAFVGIRAHSGRGHGFLGRSRGFGHEFVYGVDVIELFAQVHNGGIQFLKGAETPFPVGPPQGHAGLGDGLQLLELGDHSIKVSV